MPTTVRVVVTGTVLLLVVGATSCGQGAEVTAGGSQPTGAGSLLGDGTWELVEGMVGGAPVDVPDGYRVTLTRSGDGHVGGTSACNDYSGRVEVTGSEVRVLELGSTDMGCEPDVMAVEVAYLDGLRTVRTAARDEDRLVLSGEDVTLTYVEQPSVPTAQVVGTTWRLVTLLDGGVAGAARGDPALLRLGDDGTVTGSTGCRELSGEYVVAGDQVLLTSLSAEEPVCPPDLLDQDSHVVQVLGDGFRAAVEEGALILSSTGDLGLVYQRE